MIPTTSRRSPVYTGTGAPASYAFAFKVFSKSDIAVKVTDTTGVETTWVLDTHYTVSLNADQDNFPGGSITPIVALSAGYTLVAIGSQNYNQTTQLPNGGAYNASIVEKAFDRVVVMVQQLAEAVNRTFLLPATETTTPQTLPTLANLAGKFIAFDAGSKPFASSGTGADAGLRTDLAAPTGASLTGFQQSGLAAAVRTLLAKLRERFSVTDFTTPADAIAAAYTDNRGKMKLPVGTYNLTAGLTHLGDRNLIIEGDGYNRSILNTVTAGVVPLSIGQATANGNADIALRDFRITGAAGTGNGMNLTHLHNLRVENVRTSNNGGHGLFADRCYAATYYSLYANNNVGDGFHAAPMTGTDGNDNMVFLGSRFLGNTGKGIHIEGGAPGFVGIGMDIEGNAVGLQLDAKNTGNQNECVTVLGSYFENQVGKNISMGEDAGATFFIWNLTLQGNQFNPGTVSAASNAVSLSRVRGAVIACNHFSTVNLSVAGGQQVVIGPNKFSTATGPWSAGGTTEPMRYFLSNVGLDFVHGWMPNGWNVKHRLGVPYSGDTFVMSMNLEMTSGAGGTQDDATMGSSVFRLTAGGGGISRCSAGGGAALTNVLSWDANGLNLKSAKVDVIATASLPAAGATQDGRIVIEDAGAGDRNLIIYAGGQRFRIDGGAPF